MENLHLIVGLGNPGSKYARTRHNIGFQLVEKLAAKWSARWAEEKKFEASVARIERGSKTVLLARPQTFMNESGRSVGAISAYYHLPVERLVIAMDDADLPLGEIRLRGSGSSGGHHGLESVEQHLGTKTYPRLRLGIGRTDGGIREITGHVLAPFTEAESVVVGLELDRAVSQMECWLDFEIGKAMSQFNGSIKPL